jgi:hypothetical protein
MRWSDDQEERAVELVDLGYWRRATRIARCRRGRSCKDRSCPTCAARVARENAETAERLIRRMGGTVVVAIVSMTSLGLYDLDETINCFRRALRCLRRRACVRPVMNLVAAVEPKLARSGRRWIVHAHPVVDIDLPRCAVDGQMKAINAAWRAIIRGQESGRRGRKRQGTVKLFEHPDVDALSPEGVARYITKSLDWCPPPGTMDLPVLDAQMRGIKGRHRLIIWGKGQRRGGYRRGGVGPVWIFTVTVRRRAR